MRLSEEELDALPVGAEVIDIDSSVWVKTTDENYPWTWTADNGNTVTESTLHVVEEIGVIPRGAQLEATS